MLLYSFIFLVLFSGFFVLFWNIPKQYKKYQWILLLSFSYLFYASWKPAYLGIILLTTLVSYYSAILMHKNPSHKKHYLVFGLFTILGVFFVFKYYNFFSFTLNQIWTSPLPQLELLLPIGLSFYTLQVVGYLIDVYRNKSKPETHLGIFALFVCFFPQLSAGPIERSTTLLPQLRKPKDFNYEQISDGVKLFAFGLFKKIVIADNLAIIVDRVFTTLPNYKGLSLLIVIILYTWQIYMDFSGYTDMARGVAKMVGINLLENFNVPYLARSVQDFWRRWHISLSTWFRDYIYFPLGGSRNGIVITVISILIVFILSGLWHGAGWTFIIWGFLHGLSISAERILKRVFGDRISIPVIIKVIYAYSLVSIFWIFFRSVTIQDAIYILRNSLVGVKNFISPDYIMATLNQLFIFNKAEMVITFGLLLTAILIELLQSKINPLKLIDKQPVILRLAVYALIIFIVLELRNAEIKEFIYIRF